MNIADRIQYLRKQRGLSQEELADKIGVSRQAVYGLLPQTISTMMNVYSLFWQEA